MSDSEGWVFVGSPRDVVDVLMEAAWDDNVSDDLRIVLETGARTLADSLDRNVRLAIVIEKSGVGL
jgi:hypothetical protein